MGQGVWYAESDGQVYLVRDERGQWKFPSDKEPLPFDATERHSTVIQGVRVRCVRVDLDRHPEKWVHKDDVPTMPDVDPVVRQAVNGSLPRCVAGVLVFNKADQVLMVKASRGFTKGVWNVPGGFVEYGEDPEEAAVREVHEEVGLTIRPDRLLGVYVERFGSPYFIYAFMYAARADGKVRPAPDEISATRWMSVDEARRRTESPFARQAIDAWTATIR